MENKKSKLSTALILTYIVVSIGLFIVALVVPSFNEVFKKLSAERPYIMGFIKFSLLATAGELIAQAISNKSFILPAKVVCRFIIWGFIGVWITFMMKVYSTAVSEMMSSGALLGGDSVFLKALYTSVIMNTSFGPTFMAIHKITDRILELWDKKEKIDFSSVIGGIDWRSFWGFTILKTVPIFWIPAHTVTFLLPVEYQVMMAAALSVALGIFLSLGKISKKNNEVVK
jgi:hypothetical protein